MNKIREALGDSASSPRFVATLARRGYRFIAPVQREEAPGSVSQATGAMAQVGTGAANQHLESVSGPVSVRGYPELDLPIAHRGVTRGLFTLIQVMYLIFYIEALLHLQDVDRMAGSFLPDWGALATVVAVLVTASVGVPLRCYLVSAVGFDYRGLGKKFRKVFPFVLLLDGLWGIAPFLLMPKIGLGAALAATAGLLYLPFSERTLIRMAYPDAR